jgi:hypothetical protein
MVDLAARSIATRSLSAVLLEAFCDDGCDVARGVEDGDDLWDGCAGCVEDTIGTNQPATYFDSGEACELALDGPKERVVGDTLEGFLENSPDAKRRFFRERAEVGTDMFEVDLRMV